MRNINENIKLPISICYYNMCSECVSMSVILCVKKFKSSRHELNWFPQIKLDLITKNWSDLNFPNEKKKQPKQKENSITVECLIIT